MRQMSEPRHTILVVEDDSQILDILTILLREQGYHVVRAKEGQTALSLVKFARPALIVSDVRMPGMDGFTLCEHVRADPAFAHVPFIFLTARDEKADRRRGMGLGADDYLTKPFEPEDLLTAINVRLARVAKTQEAIAQVGARLQDLIVRTLTHEFRTPLALVIGYTDLLESSGPRMDEKEFQVALHGLHVGAQRLANLVEDFLLLTKLNTGVLAQEVREAAVTPILPDRTVEAAVRSAEELAAEKRLALSGRYQSGAAQVGVIQSHLAEITRRLVDNACKFSRGEGSEVRVVTRVEGNWWLLEVEDDGIGIDTDAMAGIFDPFQQVDRAHMEQQGTGVGLTIVRGLLQLYDGEVSVESTPGQGSIFTVRLPLLGTSGGL
jgi:two-component system, sensor histidine kinase and response regulator